MNRYKFITIVLFFFGVFLISGCDSKSNKLTCKVNSGGIKDVIIIDFNNDNTEIINIKKELIMEFNDDVTDEQISITMDSIKEECLENEYINCEVNRENNNLIYSYESKTYKNNKIDNTDIETIKEDIEKDGYKCSY